jgi:hypothetical protein
MLGDINGIPAWLALNPDAAFCAEYPELCWGAHYGWSFEVWTAKYKASLMVGSGAKGARRLNKCMREDDTTTECIGAVPPL